MWETWVQSLGWEDPLERERLPTPVFWPGQFHRLYSPCTRKQLDTTERLSLSLFSICKRVGKSRLRIWERHFYKWKSYLLILCIVPLQKKLCALPSFRASAVIAGSLWPLVQNNPYSKEAYFGRHILVSLTAPFLQQKPSFVFILLRELDVELLTQRHILMRH